MPSCQSSREAHADQHLPVRPVIIVQKSNIQDFRPELKFTKQGRQRAIAVA
jgi:hypothetical protein